MPTALERRTVNLPPELADQLDELARVRFGGSVSRALVAAVEAVVRIYDVPETYRAGDGAEALRRYVESERITK